MYFGNDRGPDLSNRQHEAARQLQLDGVLQRIPLCETSELKLVVIPPGEFVMGTTTEQLDDLARESNMHSEFRKHETPTRQVSIPQAFLLGQTEVTVEQFRLFVQDTGHRTDAEKNMGWGVDDGRWQQRKGFYWDNAGTFVIHDQHPASNLSWFDACAFCNWLNTKSLKVGGRTVRFRLPVEAEWEYACRAGSPGLWSYGSDSSRHADFAVSDSNQPQTVASRRPNGFGLHDMLGNESEWCLDVFARYESTADRVLVDKAYVTSAKNELANARRVQRGGTFSFPAIRQRSASRIGGNPHAPAQGAFRILGEFVESQTLVGMKWEPNASECRRE